MVEAEGLHSILAAPLAAPWTNEATVKCLFLCFCFFLFLFWFVFETGFL